LTLSKQVLVIQPYRVTKSINWKHNFKFLVDFIDDYARQMATHDREGIYTLSEWVKCVRSLINTNKKKTNQ